MGRCWTCGSNIPEKIGFWHTCRICTQTKELMKVREILETSSISNFDQAADLLGAEISYQLSGIASVIEWGFEELHWRIEQATGVLKSIDKTLKTPSQTQANEWRQIAEELRWRIVLDEAKEFFLKSLNTNPLDYRTHIGLGKTYLQLGEIEEAKIILEKSLPHDQKETLIIRVILIGSLGVFISAKKTITRLH